MAPHLKEPAHHISPGGATTRSQGINQSALISPPTTRAGPPAALAGSVTLTAHHCCVLLLLGAGIIFQRHACPVGGAGLYLFGQLSGTCLPLQELLRVVSLKGNTAVQGQEDRWTRTLIIWKDGSKLISKRFKKLFLNHPWRKSLQLSTKLHTESNRNFYYTSVVDLYTDQTTSMPAEYYREKQLRNAVCAN